MRHLWIGVALSLLALLMSVPKDAKAQGWKHDRPPTCAQMNVPPGRTAFTRREVWHNQGLAALEGQWQYECSRAYPGNSNYLAVYQYNAAWIWVECYVPGLACNGPRARF
jgi:hypothetical protein